MLASFFKNIFFQLTQKWAWSITLRQWCNARVNQKSSITSDEARIDVSARGFWIRGQKAFFDIRVFNPYAKSHVSRPLHAVHESQEKEKKRTYNQRIIEVEHGSFTPLVFSCTGGMARECSLFYDRLAEGIAKKQGIDKSKAVSWIRAKLSFILQRSMQLCLRGSRCHRTLNTVDSAESRDVEYECVLSKA